MINKIKKIGAILLSAILASNLAITAFSIGSEEVPTPINETDVTVDNVTEEIYANGNAITIVAGIAPNTTL